MASKKKQRPEKYRRQRSRTYKNKRKAWKRHLENHPNDEQVKTNISRLHKKYELN
jgi:hypothetical protein